MWNTVKNVPDKMGKIFPPGYEYKKEINSAGIFFGLGVGLSIQFFTRLYDAWGDLYYYKHYAGSAVAERVLREDGIVEPFVNLAEGYWLGYLPWVIFWLVAVVLHYLYYYHGTKSIYVMRRVKNSLVVIKSCVLGPLFLLASGLILMVAIYWMYYGIYLLVVPKQCMPRLI